MVRGLTKSIAPWSGGVDKILETANASVSTNATGPSNSTPISTAAVSKAEVSANITQWVKEEARTLMFGLFVDARYAAASTAVIA